MVCVVWLHVLAFVTCANSWLWCVMNFTTIDEKEQSYLSCFYGNGRSISPVNLIRVFQKYRALKQTTALISVRQWNQWGFLLTCSSNKNILKSSATSAAYMRQWTGSALIQMVACRLFVAKPFSEPMLIRKSKDYVYGIWVYTPVQK